MIHTWLCGHCVNQIHKIKLSIFLFTVLKNFHLLSHMKCKSFSCIILMQSFVCSYIWGGNEVSSGIKTETIKPYKDESKRRKKFKYITLMGSDYYSIDYKFDSLTHESPPDLDASVDFDTGPLAKVELLTKDTESEFHSISLSRNFSLVVLKKFWALQR